MVRCSTEEETSDKTATTLQYIYIIYQNKNSTQLMFSSTFPAQRALRRNDQIEGKEINLKWTIVWTRRGQVN